MNATSERHVVRCLLLSVVGGSVQMTGQKWQLVSRQGWSRLIKFVPTRISVLLPVVSNNTTVLIYIICSFKWVDKCL